MVKATIYYRQSDIILFQKSKAPFGEFSNMHMGFPYQINGMCIYCVESIYQALKFTDFPEIQKEILSLKSPMSVKFKSKKYKAFIRSDWDSIKIQVMEFCVKLKFYSYSKYFLSLFIETSMKDIAEYSESDTFWAVKKSCNELVSGRNELGIIIMNLRNEMMSGLDESMEVIPPKIKGFTLLGEEIKELKIHTDNKIHQTNNKFIRFYKLNIVTDKFSI